ncbi:hypothetical protein CLOACE_01020 [Clostridium acetireducens DSM 10703]|uniref:Uncharacterized protein n=1 Tax=Clostridium acetireducens DSM 10703 TaxID=1121290 RepID=A0A1E8F295_9CLOT|nr:hypothetical protein [Clostridium acetireducens]OFI07754.1 hypothetical protein CLOACE_01020 [Clostridium acetireducens DSM 10703]
MENKLCIFNSNKVCNNCGDCIKCDLDKNKTCNNCGKCLELEGYDLKAIKINEIIEDSEDYTELDIPKDDLDYSQEYLLEEDLKEEDIKIEYIDDITGLKEVLEDEDLFKKVAIEQFPGLIRLKKNKK